MFEEISYLGDPSKLRDLSVNYKIDTSKSEEEVKYPEYIGCGHHVIALIIVRNYLDGRFETTAAMINCLFEH